MLPQLSSFHTTRQGAARWFTRMAALIILTSFGTVCSHAALQAYLQFTPYTGTAPVGDSQDDIYKGSDGWFVLKSMSFGATQVLNIGSQSSGAGAGKVTFSDLNIQKLLNSGSPKLFQNLAGGIAYKTATLVIVDSRYSQATPMLKVLFGLVAADSQSWNLNLDGTECTELLGFQTGGIFITYTPLKADGSLGTSVSGGWNRVKNIAWDGTGTVN